MIKKMVNCFIILVIYYFFISRCTLRVLILFFLDFDITFSDVEITLLKLFRQSFN